jgi:hypothetical protein
VNRRWPPAPEPLSVKPRYKPSTLAAAVSKNDAGTTTGEPEQVVAVRFGQCLCDVRVSHRDHLHR